MENVKALAKFVQEVFGDGGSANQLRVAIVREHAKLSNFVCS